MNSDFIRLKQLEGELKLTAKWVRVVSRSGIVEKENMEFIVPLSAKMLSYISQYSGLVVIR